jgi:signal transduction histidine kinase/CheY-like chemotaxis protein
MTGFTENELSGLHLNEIFPNFIIQNQNFQTNDTFILPDLINSKSGESICIEVFLNRLKNEDDEELFCITINDVTDNKKLSEEYKKLENQIKMSRKLETLGVISGGIAHDFNNLLVCVLGNADLALCKLKEDSPVRSCLSNIKTASIRASALTNQMLAYAGKRKPSEELVNLNTLIEEMTNLLKVSIPKNIILSFYFDENIPAVEGDINQFMQILMNIITNAAQSIGDNFGSIKVKTGAIEIPENNAVQKKVFIEVKDNGAGMDSETMGKIFGAFFTTKPTGRGLGLAIVKEIVDSHMGTIEVRSTPGEGSVFRISFPASEKPLPVKTPDIGNNTPEFDKGLCALVIDDEEDVREVTGNILESYGISAFTASNGHDGLRILRETGKLDLIIIDLTMPNMNGADVFRKIRETGKNIPVIISSGYTENDIKTKFSDDDKFFFIHKPYQMKTLAEIIQKALNGL